MHNLIDRLRLLEIRELSVLELFQELLKRQNVEFELDALEDITLTSERISKVLKSIKMDVLPAKIRHHEQVFVVLSSLADLCLQNFTFEDFQIDEEQNEEVDMEIEDDVTPAFYDEIVIEKHTSRADELERVGPKLKIKLLTKQDVKSKIEQLNQILESKFELKTSLCSIIQKQMNQIDQREKYINQTLEQKIIEFNAKQQSLNVLRQQYLVETETTSKFSTQVQRTNDELQLLKEQMDELGNSMTDSKPLMYIKANLQKLRMECKQMDQRIAVLQHTILQFRLKNKTTFVTTSSDYLFNSQLLRDRTHFYM